MNNIWKRSLSMLLALVMVVGMLPMGVLAEELEASDDYADVVVETDVPDCSEGHDWGVWEPNTDESAESRVCAACGETETVVYEVEETVVAETQAAYAEGEEPDPAPLADAEGIIWMDKEKHNTSGQMGYFKGQIAKGNLDNMIRKAVGLDYDDETIKVTYDGMDVGDVKAMYLFQAKLEALQEELTDAVTYHQLVTFTVGATAMDIAFRNILTVNIKVPSVDIESKGKPADLEAKVAAALDEVVAGVVISHIDVISQEKAGADVVPETYAFAWPEAGSEDVAAQVTVSVYDSVDGSAQVGYGSVTLRDTREVYNVTYMSQGEVLLSEHVIEGEATPACNPTRTYYTLSWDKEIAETVTEDVTYTAIWTPELDVNGNNIADQEETFTVTYTDGVEDAAVFEDVVRPVKWGKATPTYTPSRKYYTFTGWDKTVAETVTNDVTYTATWEAINDDDGDNIANEEEFYTITYVDDNGDLIAEFSVKWGETTEKPENPDRPGTGYRFGGWSPVVASKVTGDATYTATWTNEALVTYITPDWDDELVDSKVNAETAKFDTQAVVDNRAFKLFEDTEDDGLIVKGWFVTTEENGVYTVTDTKWDFNTLVEEDGLILTVVYAEDSDNDGLEDGTAEDPMVTYVFMYDNWRTGVSFEMDRITVLDGAQPEWLSWEENPYNGNLELRADINAIYVNDTDDDGVIFQGWRSGQLDDSNPANLVYTFKTSLAPDDNNNGIEDGSAEDPVHAYEFWYGENMIGSELWLAGMPEVDPDKYIAALNLTYPQVFVKWIEDVQEYGMIAHIYTAVVINDANGNGIADEEEEDKLVLTLNGKEFEGQFNGTQVITGYGVIEVLNAEGKNLLFKNAADELIFSLENDTVIKVTPAEGFYVNDINLTGPNTAGWELNWDEDYSATYAKASVYLRAGVANNAEENAYTVSVDFGAAEFVYTDNSNLVLDIDEVVNYGAKEIYNELIKSPVYAEDDVTVKYLAREGGSVTVNLNTIYNMIDDSTLVTTAKQMLGESIAVTLDPAWVDVDAPAVGYKTVDEAVKAYLAANGFMKDEDTIDVDKLLESIATLEDELVAYVQNNALIQPLGYIESGKDWGIRNLEITNSNEKYFITDDTLTVQLKETRSDITISAKDMTLPYHQVKDAALLKNITVTDEDGNNVTSKVEIKLTYSKAIGTNTVTVEVMQNDAYKAAKGSFKLTVNKTAVTFEVPNVYVAMDDNYTVADVAPVVTPADLEEYVQIIAGVDVSALDLDLKKDPKKVDLNAVQIKAWIKLPEFYNSILAVVGLDTGFHTVDEIKTALTGSELEGMLNPALDAVVDTLDKAVSEIEAQLYNLVGVNYTVEITFEKDAIPTNAGAYINYVTLMDTITGNDSANYVGEAGTGILVIHPLIALPNNGIQLFLGETSNTQNVFEIVRDGEKKELGVLYEGNVVDNSVYYFGFTTRANIYISTEGPTEAGVYMAASVLYDGEEKLGSDLVAMLIAPSEANIEVSSEKIKYDGEAHKLVPTVTDSKGNVLTEGVGITMITGSVDVDAGSTNVGLSDISANLNIDFPKDLDDAWNHYVESRVDMPDAITVQTVLNFLDWCKTQIDTKVPVETLAKVVPEEYITKAQDYAKAGIDKIITELNKLPDVNASVTFVDNKQFTEHGIYVYCGVITDPDLLPDINGGVMVIYTADTFLMEDTVKVYNGLEQFPNIIDETGRDRIDMIVDRAANRVNFKLDSDANKLIEKIEKKFNVTINNNEISLQELYDRSGLKAEDLAETIIDYIWEQVPDRLKNKFPGAADKAEEMLEKLEAKLPGVRTKLINKLVEIDKLPDDLVLAFNKPGAIEVGTYEFHSFSYEIGYTTAMLEIIPEEELGTINLGEWRMDLDSVIYLNYYPALEGFAEDFDFANRGGVVIWTGDSAPTSRNQIEAGKPNTVTINGMRQNADGEWYVRTLEIFAKNLGDMVYIRPFVKAADGTYVYLDGAPYYSPAWYCYDILCNLEEREDTRAVCAALLQYGASAQTYFGYETDNLVDTDIPAGPNSKQPKKWVGIDLSIYDLAFQSSYLDELTVDSHVVKLAGTLSGIREGIFYDEKLYDTHSTLDLQGAIRLSAGFYIDTNVIDLENIAKAEVLFWTEDMIANLDALTYENAYVATLNKATGNEEVYLGEYVTKSDHILAKKLSDTVYFSCRIEMKEEAGGEVYRSGLVYYSPEAFVADHLAQSQGQIVTVCERIAVYGEMARIRFAK